MRTTARLVLASASPARLKTLRGAGIEPEVLVSGVDESVVEDSDTEGLCRTLARMKAQAVADKLGQGERHRDQQGEQQGEQYGEGQGAQQGERQGEQRGRQQGGRLVIGCDSLLDFNGEILGKPDDAAEAVRRWSDMRGRSGVLYSGHCLIDLATGRLAERVASTVVHFADVSDAEIQAYVGTGEPLQVAGSFTIDGLGGPFVERIEGDPGTVIGLSLPLLRALLAELGHQITDLWHQDQQTGTPN
jgi:septum formation protein